MRPDDTPLIPLPPRIFGAIGLARNSSQNPDVKKGLEIKVLIAKDLWRFSPYCVYRVSLTNLLLTFV